MDHLTSAVLPSSALGTTVGNVVGLAIHRICAEADARRCIWYILLQQINLQTGSAPSHGYMQPHFAPLAVAPADLLLAIK
jgi:hypothetical protein